MNTLTLIFGFKEKEKEKEQQPNSVFFPPTTSIQNDHDLVLTTDDPSFVIYENLEPQPVLVTLRIEEFGLPETGAQIQDNICEIEVTFETANGDITRTLKAEADNPLNQIATLVGKEATKVTVEATTLPVTFERCVVNIFGTNGTNFSSF